MNTRTTKFWTSAAAIVLVATGVSMLAVRYVAVVSSAEAWLTDLRLAVLAGEVGLSERLVVVSITETTVDSLTYRSPIDRAFLARLVTDLAGKEPIAIGIDIVFDHATEPEKDTLLRGTLRSTPVPVVVAWADTEDGLSPARTGYLHRFINGLPRGSVRVMAARAASVSASA